MRGPAGSVELFPPLFCLHWGKKNRARKKEAIEKERRVRYQTLSVTTCLGAPGRTLGKIDQGKQGRKEKERNRKPIESPSRYQGRKYQYSRNSVISTANITT